MKETLCTKYFLHIDCNIKTANYNDIILQILHL